MASFSSLSWRQDTSAPTGDEVIVQAFDTHWSKYVLPTVVWIALVGISVALLISAGVGVASSTFIQKLVFLVAVSTLTFGNHWFFHNVLSKSMEDIIITNRRFIYLESSLWSIDEMQEISLRQIKAVEAQKRGLLQNILRFGHISFDTGGSDMNERTFKRIPHPDRKAQVITRLLRSQAADQ